MTRFSSLDPPAHHGGYLGYPRRIKRCTGRPATLHVRYLDRSSPAEAGERCRVAIQTNNVEVDDRGYIYIVDRANTGMHILELTGEARQRANFPR